LKIEVSMKHIDDHACWLIYLFYSTFSGILQLPVGFLFGGNEQAGQLPIIVLLEHTRELCVIPLRRRKFKIQGMV